MRLCGNFSASFHLPHISRLLLRSSWIKYPISFSVHPLFVSTTIQPLHRHQNHIKTSSKLLAFCLRSDCFQKIRTKRLLVCMYRQVRCADCHFQKSSTLRGDIEKTGIAPGSFYCLWRLQGYVSCVISAFPLLIDHRYPWIILR